jgi:glycosyltransferase involved in cell wall biosynthesis
MRISYLLGGFGYTGGVMVLSKFMDELCERGHTVYAITPRDAFQWKRGLIHEVNRKYDESKSYRLRGTLYNVGKRIAKRSRVLAGAASVFLNRSLLDDSIEEGKLLTQRLIQNWVQSEITISTFCTTAYANYALMDRTIPMYHMQSYEELFFDDEVSRKIARLTYFLPLGLIANSKWLRGQIKDRTRRDSYLLNPGIDTGVFCPRGDAAGKYECPSKITLVSYYSPRRFKAWDDALKAMRIVFEKVGKDRLEWVAFGDIPSSMPDLPVKFVGKTLGASLAQLYSSAYIVFMNSWFESFPLPPLEAMACGTAVVTTRLGTEDYAYDGENALVIPPKQPEALAEAVIKLIDEPAVAGRLARNGIETAREFTWNKAADRLEEIIQQAIASDHGKGFADITEVSSGGVEGVAH